MDKQGYEHQTPPPIQEITDHQYKSILPAQLLFKIKPIQYKYYW